MIPRIIHQTWVPVISPEMPERFRASRDSWKAMHPDWTYILWGQDEIDRLVHEHYPHLEQLFHSYPDWIQRVDAARYLILHHCGGIHSDLDVICCRPFDDLLGHELVLAATEPLGVASDLILAEKSHPFVTDLTTQLASAFTRWQHWYVPRHFRILLTTGPLFLTLRYRAFAHKDAIKLLGPDLYGATGSPDQYVRHVEGNTWAKWDTHFFVFLNRHWRWFLAAGAAVAALAVIAAV
jgi:mannosyltransferase OCH1-like enzyme